MSRESSTAAADDAGFLDEFQDFLAVELFPVVSLGNPFCPFIFAICFDDDSHAFDHHVVRHRRNFDDFAGRRCMDVGMQECVTRPDKLAFLDQVTDFDGRRTRRTKVLAHGNDDLSRYCRGFYGFVFCIDLAIVRMDPTSFKGIQHQKSPHYYIMKNNKNMNHAFNRLHYIIM